MDLHAQPVKMVPVDADLFESIGYVDFAHCLRIKFRNSPTMRFEKVPRFRYQGLLAAPRKDAYYRTFIQNQFLSKPV
jgi:hypothetical protein